MQESVKQELKDQFTGNNTFILESTERKDGTIDVLVQDGLVTTRYYVFKLESCGEIIQQFSFKK